MTKSDTVKGTQTKAPEGRVKHTQTVAPQEDRKRVDVRVKQKYFCVKGIQTAPDLRAKQTQTQTPSAGAAPPRVYGVSVRRRKHTLPRRTQQLVVYVFPIVASANLFDEVLMNAGAGRKKNQT